MNPDDVVLVALLNNARDFERVRQEHWYRIPQRYAPKYFTGAQYLAFYFARGFGEQKWSIRAYAPVRGHELVRRRELLPAEPDHPRADEPYYKLQLGALETREPPIVSKRGRRILFLWTTWKKFSTARELNDLMGKRAVEDSLWEGLKAADLDAEREISVREGHARYRVDFLIYCPRGRVGVTIGGEPIASTRGLRGVALSEQEVEQDFERALAKVCGAARAVGEEFSTLE